MKNQNHAITAQRETGFRCIFTESVGQKLLAHEILQALQRLLERADECLAKGLDMWMATTDTGKELWCYLDIGDGINRDSVLTLFVPPEDMLEKRRCLWRHDSSTQALIRSCLEDAAAP